MKQIVFILTGLTLFGVNLGYAQKNRVDSVNYDASSGQAQLIIHTSETPKFRYFTLDHPARLVIDLTDTSGKAALAQPKSDNPIFAKLRAAPKNDTDLRMVLELKPGKNNKPLQFSTSGGNDNQLVFVAAGTSAGKTEKTSISSKKKAEESVADVDNPIEADVVKTAAVKSSGKKRFVVAIDAGHGGDDPGAHGPNGTHEKKVTLAIAKKLEALINAEPGMRAKLVRKGDYYVGLRERMKIARKAKADLFISIHADAVNDPNVRGASVYTLSRTGASNEAAHWLADSENAKEKVGGVNLDDKENIVATVLLDLSQTATQDASNDLAEKVLKNFKGIGGLHYTDVQSAGFVVLKSPDIPSILVETAYISNPSDELNLVSPRYQSKMASAIFRGVLNYFQQRNPVDGNRVAKL